MNNRTRNLDSLGSDGGDRESEPRFLEKRKERRPKRVFFFSFCFASFSHNFSFFRQKGRSDRRKENLRFFSWLLFFFHGECSCLSVRGRRRTHANEA